MQRKMLIISFLSVKIDEQLDSRVAAFLPKILIDIKITDDADELHDDDGLLLAGVRNNWLAIVVIGDFAVTG